VEVTVPGASVHVAIDDPSGVGLARREAQLIGRRAGLADGRLSDLLLVVTELANNVVAHGRGGELALRPTGPGETPAVDVLALDRGPGMDIERCLADGYSTAGTPPSPTPSVPAVE
jgi:anti-sigma regulatory factor (Ser/Thr protein kinase)